MSLCMHSPIASEIKSLLSYFSCFVKDDTRIILFLPEREKKQLEYLFIECKAIPGFNIIL